MPTSPSKPKARSSRSKLQVASKPADRHHHGDLKEALLTAATKLMVQRGRADFTLRELAQMAGVSHTATYKHFADKDSLLAVLALRGFMLLSERQHSLIAKADGDPWRELVSTGEAYVGFALDYPAHFHVMFDQRLSEVWRRNEEVRQAQAQPLAALVHAIEACQHAGLFSPQIPVERILAVLWSCGHGLANLLGGGLADFLGLRGTSPKPLIEMLSNVVPRCIQDERSLPWLAGSQETPSR